MTGSDPGRVLLLHGGALGDCLLAFHLVRRLVADPARDLFVCARNSVHRWLWRRGLIAASAFADDCGVTTLFSDRPSPSPNLRDWIAASALIVNMIDPPQGPVERSLTSRFASRVASIDPRADGSNRHIVEQWAGQLDRAGLSAATRLGKPTPLQLSAETRLRMRTEIRRRIENRSSPIVLIHPGGGGTRKHAPLEWFESVAVNMASMRRPIAWMIGPDEAQRDGSQLHNRLERSAPLIFEPDICVAADLVAGADVFVGNDSGMGHVAALGGIRSIVWFGPTDPAVWRPVGPDVHILRDTDQNSFVDRVMQLVSSVHCQDE